jgi:NitT/TauT family transport system substrate-binding protein
VFKTTFGLRSRVLAAAAAVALLAGACGSDTDSSPSAKEEGGLTKLRISASLVDALPFMAVLKVADEKGYFEDEGIDVEFYSGSGGGSTLRVVSTGDADLAITGASAAVQGAASDPNLTITSSWVPVNQLYWIAPEEISDLNGKKIGSGPAGSLTNVILAGVKEQTGSDFEMVPLTGMSEGWAAAKSGKVDAAWVMDPYMTQIVDSDPSAKVVINADVVRDFLTDVVVVNSQFAEDNPDAVKGFYTATQKIFDEVVSDPASTATALSKIMGLDAAVIQKSLENSTIPLDQVYSFKTVPAAFENTSDLMLAEGSITEPVDWAKVLDQEYLPKAARADL